MWDGIFIGGAVATAGTIRGMVGEKVARGDKRTLSVAVVEPRENAGVGAAWDEAEEDAMMLSNMHRDRLTMFGTGNRIGALEFETPRDFMPDSGMPRSSQPYAPRSEVGASLRQYFEETVGIAYSAGIVIKHIRAEAVRVTRLEEGFAVELSDGKVHEAPLIVLALGLLAIDNHPGLAGRPGYHADAWDRRGPLGEIEQDSRVAIIGCGPTGIDWALRFGPLALRRPVQLVSRSGRLPAVRPVVGPPIKDSHYSRARLRAKAAKRGPMSPDEVDDVVIGVMAEAGAKPADLTQLEALSRPGGRLLMETTLQMSEKVQPFFEGLKVLDDLSTTIWRCSSPEARDHIMSRWAGRQATYSFAIPPPNARAILAGIGAGRIATRGGLTGIAHEKGAFQLRFRNPDGKEIVTEADIVINASGIQGELGECTNKLVRAMMADGLLRPARHGGAEMLYDTGEILDTEGRPVPGLFAVGGSLSRSAAYLVNSIVDTSEHGVRVGMECARFLIGRRLQHREIGADDKPRQLKKTGKIA